MTVDRKKEREACLSLPDDHSIKLFLVEHRRFCNMVVGHELGLKGARGVDHSWWSAVLGRQVKLSDMLYKYISLTPELPGWNTVEVYNQSALHDFMTFTHSHLHDCRTVLGECLTALGTDAPGDDIMRIVNDALHILELWGTALDCCRAEA